MFEDIYWHNMDNSSQ